MAMTGITVVAVAMGGVGTIDEGCGTTVNRMSDIAVSVSVSLPGMVDMGAMAKYGQDWYSHG